MRFSDVLDIRNGRNQRQVENENGKYPIYGSGGVMGHADDFICDAETVVIGRKGSINNPIFVDEPFWNVDTAFGLVAHKEVLLPKYLYYFCVNFDFERLNTTVTIPSLTKANLLQIEIRVPDMDIQQNIVSVLDKICYLIELRQKELYNLDQLVKSRFIEMFGNPKSNPNSYPISQLSEHIKFLTSGSRGWAQYCVDNGSEWFITIKNVKDCRISIDNMQPINAPDNAEAKRTKVQEGDLLISITADLGRTGVVTKEIADHGAYINQHLTCIRLNKEILNPMYVAFFMESPAGKEQFESKNQSAVKAGLNFNSINSLRLLVPPLELQNQFAAFVAQTDKSKFVRSGVLTSPNRKSVETSNTFAMRSKCSVLILSVLPLTNRLMALSVLPMRVASWAWVILCSFISSCIRCRILPGR